MHLKGILISLPKAAKPFSGEPTVAGLLAIKMSPDLSANHHGFLLPPALISVDVQLECAFPVPLTLTSLPVTHVVLVVLPAGVFSHCVLQDTE